MLRWRPEWPVTVLVAIAWIALLARASAVSSSSIVLGFGVVILTVQTWRQNAMAVDDRLPRRPC